jgi:putative membrane protein
MKRSALILMSATACALAACSHSSDTTTTDNSTTTTANSDTAVTDNASDATAAPDNAATPAATGGQAFANNAAASDAFEIASSKLAATNGSDASVKKFATQMIAAHTESTTKLKGIATGLTPPVTPDPALNSDQQAKLDELKAKKGADFDKTYVADQVAAHEQALTMLQDYAKGGDVPAFKDFATGLAPKVAAHLNMAKSLKP